jgi:small subunit ribosomal protein S16
MIKIRLQRHGARHAPFYRMVVAPSTARRDGRFIEVLGTYNPQAHARVEELNLKMDRVDHWLGVGAQPTDTAKSLIKQGRLTPEEWLERSEREAAKKIARAKKGKSAPVMEEPTAEKTEEPANENKAEDPALEAKSEKAESVSEEKKEEPTAEKTEEPANESKAEEPALEATSEKAEPVSEEKKEEPTAEKTEEPAKEGKVEEPKVEAKSDKTEPVSGEKKEEGKADKTEGDS